MDPSIENLLTQIHHQQRRIEDIQQSVAKLKVTGRAGNGEVTVELAGDGRLTRVAVDPQLLRGTNAELLGELVVEAVNDGQRRLAEASRARFAPVVAEARRRVR